MKDFLTFEVSGEQYKKFLNWKNKLPKKYKKFIPTWSFKNYGIGENIFVTLGDKTLDLTDYDTW